MGQYLDTIKQNGKYRSILELQADDLIRLKNHKFQEYMEEYDGELCKPIFETYVAFQDITSDKTPPSPNFIIKIADETLRHKGGMEDFRKEVLTLEQHTPPKCEELYGCFAKALACICCIHHELYKSRGGLNG